MNKNHNEEILKYVEKIKEGNTFYLNKLLQDFDPLIRSLSYGVDRMSVPITKDCLMAYLKVKFWELTNDYDFNSQKTYPAYIKEFLTYERNNYIRKFRANKHKSMNTSSQLEESIYVEEIFDKEKVEDYFDLNMQRLSKSEKDCLEMYIKGMSPTEIAKEMDKSITAIYAMKQKIIRKLQNREQP